MSNKNKMYARSIKIFDPVGTDQDRSVTILELPNKEFTIMGMSTVRESIDEFGRTQLVCKGGKMTLSIEAVMALRELLNDLHDGGWLS